MFDISKVVPSARSTYFNLALFGPEFFWLAILCLPIFVAAWIFAPNIIEKFNLSGREVIRRASAITVAIIALWLLTHGSYSALRDTSAVSILVAVCLFVCAAFLTRRVLELGFKLSDHIKKIKEKWRKWFDWGVPVVAATAIGGIAGAPGWLGFALSGGAVLVGIGVGWVLHRRGRANDDPSSLRSAETSFGWVVILLAAAITAGVAMQPEFFRFGSMGSLTILHKIALLVTGGLIAMDLTLRVARPRGAMREPIYKKVRLVMRLLAILALLLFVFTESAIVLGGFCVIAAILFYMNVWHSPRNTDWSEFQRGIFLAAIAMFGILISVPLLPIGAIILWRLIDRREFPGLVKKMI